MPQILEHGEVTTVIRSHAGWVYACARRRVGNGAMAEDVTQAVFILLWRKWGNVGDEGIVTRWLYRAVRYCAKEALRANGIRQRHEREAAMAKKQSERMAGWTEVEGELEGAMDKLSEKDREVVLLRFYRGLSLQEVGAAMGLSEEAAKKRVQRAVEKLRAMLGKKGVSGTTAGLSAVLVGNVVGQMPGHLVEKIVSAVGSGGGNTVAAGIAKGAMKMMTMAKVRVLLCVVAACGVVAVGAAQMLGTSGDKPVPATAAAPPAALRDPESTPIAGALPRYANWEFILTEQAGKALLAACRNESRDQAGYALYRGTLSSVHPVLNQAWATGSVINVQNDDGVRFEQVPPVPMAARQMGGRAPDGSQVDVQRSGDLYLPVARTDTGFDIALKDLQVQATAWNRRDGSSRKWTGTLNFEAEVHLGEVLLAVQEIDFGAGDPVLHVLGWECFQATGSQYDRITAAGWRGEPWFSRQPADLRVLADAAYATDAALPGSATTRVVKLKNGTTARLIAVANPAQHPLVAWNPDGGKTLWNWSSYLSHLSDQQGFIGIVELYDTNAVPQSLLPNDRYIDANVEKGQGLGIWYAWRIAHGDATAGQLRFAVAAGPWKEVGPIAVGKRVTFEGVTIRMPQQPQALGAGCTIPVVSKTREWEFNLTATTHGGQTVEGVPDQWPSTFLTSDNDGRIGDFTKFAVPADEIATYTLRARRVEWVSFDNIATAPAVPARTGTQDAIRSQPKTDQTVQLTRR